MSSLLSLDIDKNKIRLVEGSFQKGIITVEKAAVIDVPDGTFNGETIQNFKGIADSIADAVQRHGFIAKDAIVTFDAFGSIIRDLELPTAKPKELVEMIRSEMIQSYQIPSDSIIQFRSVEKLQSATGSPLEKYRVAAIDREIVEAYHQLLTESKLKPMVMDININAISKLLEGEVTVNDTLLSESGTLFIDFDELLTTVYIVAKDKPIFFRHLDSGYKDMERIIHEQTFESEEAIRRMKEEGYNFFGESAEEQAYFNILRPFFYTMIDEIRKIIGFYSSRSTSNNVDRIFTMGCGSELKGFTEYCENSFGLPSQQVTNLSRVKVKDPATSIACYINAIGALIRY